MPVFDTPDPIAATLELAAGRVRIVAGDRGDTAVEVRPGDPARPRDVAAAEQTRVECVNGTLSIRSPKGRRPLTPWAGGDSVEVEVGLPAGSTVRVEAGIAAVSVTGRLRECRVRSGAGSITLERVERVDVRTGAGDVTVERVTERADIVTASGTVRVGAVDGSAVVRTSNGDASLGEVAGDLRVSTANGGITVERAGASVVARTARGDIRLAVVERGTVEAHTAFGGIEVGIRPGVAAWLDLDSGFGRVASALEAGERPQPGEPSVEVRARTGMGDIAVRRAVPAPEPAGV